MPKGEAELLHKQSSRHRSAIEQSRIVGCFYCEEFFPPAEITTWLNEPVVKGQKRGQTAVCPRCGIDAVLPEWNGVLPMGAGMLRMMRRVWFGEREQPTG